MKKKIVFATNNKHKQEEIAQIVGDHFEILSLKDIQCDDEIPETADTFEGNALQKAAYIHEKYGIDCFADDSGLEVEALDNAPGVRSARYSGGGSEQNMDKLLGELKDKSNRRAQFRTVIALILEGKVSYFEGVVKGEIMESRHGSEGFGYDPLFRPDGFSETFAEMESAQKNKISHRGKATQLLIQYLNSRV
ncbi:MAG: non-canonical purine NTP diphosphatase [Bacteroidales bacterium]|nr:non-canonical purine NTP diphosphatase [Bacteroidales bacterium]